MKSFFTFPRPSGAWEEEGHSHKRREAPASLLPHGTQGQVPGTRMGLSCCSVPSHSPLTVHITGEAPCKRKSSFATRRFWEGRTGPLHPSGCEPAPSLSNDHGNSFWLKTVRSAAPLWIQMTHKRLGNNLRTFRDGNTVDFPRCERPLAIRSLMAGTLTRQLSAHHCGQDSAALGFMQ